jgi:hypothetical protein
LIGCNHEEEVLCIKVEACLAFNAQSKGCGCPEDPESCCGIGLCCAEIYCKSPTVCCSAYTKVSASNHLKNVTFRCSNMASTSLDLLLWWGLPVPMGERIRVHTRVCCYGIDVHSWDGLLQTTPRKWVHGTHPGCFCVKLYLCQPRDMRVLVLSVVLKVLKTKSQADLWLRLKEHPRSNCPPFVRFVLLPLRCFPFTSPPPATFTFPFFCSLLHLPVSIFILNFRF